MLCGRISDKYLAMNKQRMTAFRKNFFPECSDAEWDDWRWQLRNRIREPGQLERLFALSEDERKALGGLQRFPFSITPYYAALLDPEDAAQPLRRTKIPTSLEQVVNPGEHRDPLGEDVHTPLPGIVHTYPDKVLFLVTDFCATYCRYCTRSRMVGAGEFLPDKRQWEEALDYIRAQSGIRDVLLSGGDPLILSDERLEWLISRLHAIPHVEFIRIETKVPAVLPQRITPELTTMLRKYHPVWMSIHFTHPDELTPEVEQAAARLADAGIPMGSQTVLLKGVNDDLPTLKKLFQGLLRLRVQPYYLHQCDPVLGSAHFKTRIEDGQALIRGLHGHTTGYAVPTYMLDAPGGGGKVPLTPDYIQGREGRDWVVKNYLGETYRYRDGD